MRVRGILFAICCLISSQVFAAKNSTSLSTFEIDPVHTFVLFKVNHFGFSHSYGRFTDVQGHFSIDENKPENSKIDIKINAASIDTQNKKRDKHLRSPDFFNVKQYPEISFKSTAVKKTGKGKYKVSGQLTMHGTSKPVSFGFTRLRTGKGPGGKIRTGGDFSFTVKRSDFGIKFMMGENLVGNDITIIASVEGVKK